MEFLLHPNQLATLVFGDRVQRDARPLRDDLVNVRLANLHARGRRLHVHPFAHERDLIPRGRIRLAERPGFVDHRHLAIHFDRRPHDPTDLAEFGVHLGITQLGPRPGLVNEVDGLVGQESIRDVAAGLVDGGLDGLPGVLDVMERLVPILDAHQDLNRLEFTRGLHLHGLEAPFERTILFDIPTILGRRRRPNTSNFAARERRLENVGGIERPLGRSRAHQRVQLVDEHDDVRVLGELLHDRLQALFELTPVLGAGHDQRNVERQHPLVGQEVRDVAAHDLLRQPFHDRGLADTRLADEHHVVLRPPAEHLLQPLHLGRTADEGIELVLHRRFGQVTAEFRQQRGFLRPGRRGLLVEQLDDVFTHRRQAHALLVENRRRNRPLLTENAEQQMFGADVGVQQPIRFFGRKLQHALGLGAEGNLDRRRDLLAEDRAALNLLADTVERQVGSRKNATRQPFALTNQPQQKVLRLDLTYSRAGWLRSGRRTERAALVPCSVQTSSRPPESEALSAFPSSHYTA